MAHSLRSSRFLLATLLGAMLLTGLVFLPYLNTLTLAVVMGIFFLPVADFLKPRLRSESLTALVTLLIAMILVIAPLAFFGVQAGQEALDVYARLTRDHTIGELTTTSLPLHGVIERLPASVRDLIPQQISLGPLLHTLSAWAVGRLGSVFGIVSTLFLELFLFLVGMYYVLKDGRKLAVYIAHVLPFDQGSEQLLLKKLHTSVISVVRGSLATAVLQGIVAGLGFFLVGVPNAALWGSATMIASLIPILGTALTIVPAVLYLLLTGSIIPAVLLILWGFFVVSVVDNIFRGQFMKKGIDVHPFFILLSVLGGLEFFGPIGFISGPLLLAIVTTLLDLYLTGQNAKAAA